MDILDQYTKASEESNDRYRRSIEKIYEDYKVSIDTACDEYTKNVKKTYETVNAVYLCILTFLVMLIGIVVFFHV